MAQAADSIATEVLRYGLIGLAEEMTVVLQRTAFSPIIYDRMDFACALYDSRCQLLAQGRSMPLFLGTLDAAVNAALEAYPGARGLEPGDVVFMTSGYHHGTHNNDATMVAPAFVEGAVAGFAVVKAHYADIGAKDPFSIDSIDVFQEGTLFPPVKMYRRGELDSDLYRTLLANSRTPTAVAGDLEAQVGAARSGAEGLARTVARLGAGRFEELTGAIHAHGERLLRDFYARVPDGVYSAQGALDNNGVSDVEIPFTVQIEIAGGRLIVSMPDAPPEQPGPANSPRPLVVGAARFALVAPTLEGLPINEGCFRPIDVLTIPGTIFEPRIPAPIMLYSAPANQLIDTIHRALASAAAELLPAGSAGDFCGMTWSGRREKDRSYWTFSAGQSNVGQGADWEGDGASALSIPVVAGVRTAPVEVLELRYPVRFEKRELAADSGGVGRFRGGLGIDVDIRTLEPTELIGRFERTKHPSWGLEGGFSGRPNQLAVHLPDGSVIARGRFRAAVPPDTVVQIRTGGGGGYGDPAERDLAAIQADLLAGYVSEPAAREAYPRAFSQADGGGS